MKSKFVAGTASLAVGLFLFSSSPLVSADEHGKHDAATQSFLKEAAQGGMTEVTLGQLASEKAKDDAVKSFGQRMVKDHGKSNEELQKLAHTEGVTLPTDMGSEGKD